MKLLNFNRVLCLSPHPDDVEYSMSGTIMKCTDTIFDIVCLSNGGDCDTTTGVDRLNEVKNFWEGSNSNVNLYFSENRFLRERKEEEWVNWIETNFLKNNSYDCIFTTSNIDSHFEHQLINRLGPALIRGIWPNRKELGPPSLIEYKSPSTLDEWNPSFVVDIENTYGKKKLGLVSFTSQLHHNYFNTDILDAFHTNYQCCKKGMMCVEEFKIKNLYIK
jgi:LmbE family N-acetylglucosaminyl deacetylase